MDLMQGSATGAAVGREYLGCPQSSTTIMKAC